MKKTTLLCLIAAVAMVSSGSARAGQIEREAERKSTVTVNGVFSGSLEGEIWVDGTRVVITRKTALHSVEDGRVKRGYHVIRRPVYISGVMERNGIIRATMVIVRAPAPSKLPAPTRVDPDEGS
jgi:hypothetical protein